MSSRKSATRASVIGVMRGSLWVIGANNKQLQVQLVEDNNEDSPVEAEDLEPDQAAFNEDAELSLNSVVGIYTPKTMKL